MGADVSSPFPWDTGCVGKSQTRITRVYEQIAAPFQGEFGAARSLQKFKRLLGGKNLQFRLGGGDAQLQSASCRGIHITCGESCREIEQTCESGRLV